MEAAAALWEIVAEEKRCEFARGASLATPLHSNHIGKQHYAHGGRCSAQRDCLSSSLLYPPFLFPPINLPLSLVPSLAPPFRHSGRQEFTVNLQGSPLTN